MKRSLLLVVWLLLLSPWVLFGQPLRIAVTLPPIQSLVEEIGGAQVQVSVLVPGGQDPHTFAPRPSQMREMLNVEVYFAIGGITAEDLWLSRLQGLNRSMQVVAITEGIERLQMVDHEHHDDDAHSEESEGADPHLWLSPKNMSAMAEQVLEELMKRLPDSHAELRANHQRFQQEVAQLDEELRRDLAELGTRRAFLVFHPSWGYFAEHYDLTQMAIETEGKEPRPAQLQEIIQEAQALGIKSIWVQPQRSSRLANSLAESLGGSVVTLNPLAADWRATLRQATEALLAQRD